MSQGSLVTPCLFAVFIVGIIREMEVGNINVGVKIDLCPFT